MPDDLTQLESLRYYARKFQRLRVDRAHGVAPHKPILLLSVMENIERGKLTENHIDLSRSLNHTFLKYWSYLGSAQHYPDISRPYFHMKSGKFWHLVMNPGFEPILAAKIKLKTWHEVRQAVSHAYLDEDLFEFLQIPNLRDSLRSVLVAQWFPGRLDEIIKISQTDDFQDPPGYFKEAYALYLERLKEA